MRRTIAAIVGLLSLSDDAQAQAPANSFSELAGRVRLGEKVLVTIEGGGIVRGEVNGVSDTTLVLRRGRDRVQLASDRVERVERPRDTLANGVLGGFAAGVAVGALLVAADSCQPRPFVPCFSRSPGIALRVGALFGLAGAAIGGALDAVTRRERVVFVRSSGAGVIFRN